MKALLKHTSKYYKERGFRTYVLNAPMLFSGLYSIAKLLIDKKTQQKIVISSKNSHEYMLQHIPRSQLEKRFGGELDQPSEGNFFPPIYRRDLT